MQSALAVLLATLLSGCSIIAPNLTVGPSSPRPNVVVAPDKAPAALLLAPEIADDYVIPATGSVSPVPVHGWRHTLEAGFASAFPPATTGRTLQITNAELTFSPAAVGYGGTRAVIATIRFKAALLDGSGKEQGAMAGTVQAREANVSPSEAGMTDNAAKAVEALYEELATQLLAKH